MDAKNSQKNSPKSPSSTSSVVQPQKNFIILLFASLKSYLKYFYRKIKKNSPPELLKPIKWYNSFYWYKYTFKTEKNHYLTKTRPFSLKRLTGFIKPNLKKPIFIVGSPRSGTTFLGNCIAEIPEVSYHFEPVATKAAARYVYNNLWSENKSQRFYRFIYSWLMRLHFDGDLRFAEKTPQISFIIPFLAKTFPDAKFIHIIRDGRDVAISLAEKPWHQSAKKGSTIRDPDGYLCGPWARFWVEPERVEEFETTDDLHRCIWIWRRHVEEAIRGAINLPSNYYELKYEDLVRNPLEESQKILDFLEIYNHDSRKIFQDTLTANIKPNSVNRWQKELSDNQLKHLNNEAIDLLKQLGYQD